MPITYQNQADFRGCKEMGEKGESHFDIIATAYGWKSILSSEEENKTLHIDRHIYKDNLYHAVDVKSVKEGGDLRDFQKNGYFPVELRGGSYDGWAIKSGSDIIAFMLSDYSVLLSYRQPLADYALSIVHPQYAWNQNYQATWLQFKERGESLVAPINRYVFRREKKYNTEDLLILIHYNELINLPHEIWSVTI